MTPSGGDTPCAYCAIKQGHSSNVETVIVAGKVRKWRGKLLDVDLGRLRDQLEDSRNFIYQKAGVPQNLFR
jgi:5-methylthioadenosine/S-adenosylhomocysteine deaminase